jgi:hypothetical protein
LLASLSDRKVSAGNVIWNISITLSWAGGAATAHQPATLMGDVHANEEALWMVDDQRPVGREKSTVLLNDCSPDAWKRWISVETIG